MSLFMALAASLASPSAARAQTTPAAESTATDRSPLDAVAEHLGLGYFTSDAPVGARYWLDRTQAADLGLHIALSSGDVEAYGLGLELGYLRALAHYHYAVVFGRAGLGWRILDTFGDHSGPSQHAFNANLFLGAELFLGAFGFPNVSLQGGYGLQANWGYRGGTGFVLGTTSGGLNLVAASQLGFHIYL